MPKHDPNTIPSHRFYLLIQLLEQGRIRDRRAPSILIPVPPPFQNPLRHAFDNILRVRFDNNLMQNLTIDDFQLVSFFKRKQARGQFCLLAGRHRIT